MLTPDERLVWQMSQHLQPQDIVVQGIATPIVFAAFLLAKEMHAPNLQCLFTVGNTFCQSPSGRLGISALEAYTTEQSLRKLGMLDIHCDVVPSLQVTEFLRPAQVDGEGNTNNVVIGEWNQPKVRLPGAVGITDVLSFNPNIYLYVARHDRRTLVEKVDFCSGVGTGSRAKEMESAGFGPRGPRRLITPEAVFDFKQGHAVLSEIAPGTSVEDISSLTGFRFSVSGDLQTMFDPPEEAMDLLRNVIDPLGVRQLETTSGLARLTLIRKIVAAEKVQVS